MAQVGEGSKTAKFLVAQQACRALRELDKVSFLGNDFQGYVELRRKTLDLIDECGYVLKGDPWRLVVNDSPSALYLKKLKEAGLTYFLVQRAPNGGYQHRNIGAPQSYIIGPDQTCCWYKIKGDAIRAASHLNNLSDEKLVKIAATAETALDGDDGNNYIKVSAPGLTGAGDVANHAMS